MSANNDFIILMTSVTNLISHRYLYMTSWASAVAGVSVNLSFTSSTPANRPRPLQDVTPHGLSNPRTRLNAQKCCTLAVRTFLNQNSFFPVFSPLRFHVLDQSDIIKVKPFKLWSNAFFLPVYNRSLLERNVKGKCEVCHWVEVGSGIK